MKEIGLKIKARREEIGMSVDTLGQKIGKNRATVYRYENGDIEGLKIGALLPIASALNVSPGYFLSDLSDSGSFLPAAPSIDPDEQQLLDKYRSLNVYGKRRARQSIDDLTKISEYIDSKAIESLA